MEVIMFMDYPFIAYAEKLKKRLSEVELNKKFVKDYKLASELTNKELWDNAGIVGDYKETTDATYLIGKHYFIWDRAGTEKLLHELKVIPISDIKATSEELEYKIPVYEALKTQAPPIDVTIERDGSIRVWNGHRRLKSAVYRGEKYIFVEIHRDKRGQPEFKSSLIY